jgi:hypothetical protein
VKRAFAPFAFFCANGNFFTLFTAAFFPDAFGFVLVFVFGVVFGFGLKTCFGAGGVAPFVFVT